MGRLFVPVIFFLFLTPLFSWTIDTGSILDSRIIGKDLEIFEDPSATLTFSQAVHFKSFEPYTSDVPAFGFSRSAYWVRFSLSNTTGVNKPMVLKVSFPLLDRIDFCEVGVPECRVTGIKFPFSQRDILNRNFLFKINLNPGEVRTIYMRFVASDSLQFPLTLYTEDAFNRDDHYEQFGLGIYYGIILVMAFYNFFILLTVRDRGYFYYVIYILVFGLFLFSQYGLAFEFLWPEFTSGAGKMNPFLAAFLEFSILLFTGQFLNTKVNSPLLHRLMIIQMIFALLTMGLSWIIDLTYGAFLVLVLGITASITVLSSGIAGLFRSFRPARYFMIAFSMLVIGAISYALKTFGILPVNFFTVYGMQMGSALEVTLLSLGLADRMSGLIKEKDAAQKALILEQNESLAASRRLTESYARMVPAEFIRILEKESILDVRPGDQVLKDMTVVFSDIRAFTQLSERMTPRESFNFLNAYLRRMNPVIRSNGGYVDKYIGDGILALFPAAADDALTSSVEMIRILKEYNLERVAEGFVPIEIGIGIHSGELMFGTIGGEDRLEVTVISDTVNLASRIEGFTKEFKTSILISSSTFNTLRDPSIHDFRLIGSMPVRGKTQPVTLFEIFTADEPEVRARKSASKRFFETGVTSFYNRDFKEARDCFIQALEISPDDEAALSYLRRLPALEESANPMPHT